jgi:hypothetical protein
MGGPGASGRIIKGGSLGPKAAVRDYARGPRVPTGFKASSAVSASLTNVAEADTRTCCTACWPSRRACQDPSRRRVRRGSSCEAAPAEPAAGEACRSRRNWNRFQFGIAGLIAGTWSQVSCRGTSRWDDAEIRTLPASWSIDWPRGQFESVTNVTEPRHADLPYSKLRVSPSAGSAGAASQLDPRLTRLRLGRVGKSRARGRGPPESQPWRAIQRVPVPVEKRPLC